MIQIFYDTIASKAKSYHQIMAKLWPVSLPSADGSRSLRSESTIFIVWRVYPRTPRLNLAPS